MSMPKALVEPPAAGLFMGLRVFIFKRLSLKENGRIIPLRPLERVKGRKGPTDGYLFDMTLDYRVSV
jgi:hypothetical protein